MISWHYARNVLVFQFIIPHRNWFEITCFHDDWPSTHATHLVGEQTRKPCGVPRERTLFDYTGRGAHTFYFVAHSVAHSEWRIPYQRIIPSCFPLAISPFSISALPIARLGFHQLSVGSLFSIRCERAIAWAHEFLCVRVPCERVCAIWTISQDENSSVSVCIYAQLHTIA